MERFCPMIYHSIWRQSPGLTLLIGQIFSSGKRLKISHYSFSNTVLYFIVFMKDKVFVWPLGINERAWFSSWKEPDQGLCHVGLVYVCVYVYTCRCVCMCVFVDICVCLCKAKQSYCTSKMAMLLLSVFVVVSDRDLHVCVCPCGNVHVSVCVWVALRKTTRYRIS